MDEAKPFKIPKREVWEAFKRVKANQGAAGVDGQSIADFEASLSGNLYKLWNRLSSGSYFPPPVRRVDIPKANGGTRPLSIPTATGPANLPSMPCARLVSAVGAPTGCSILMCAPSLTASIGSSCSRQSGVIRTAHGCCSTSSAG